MKIALIGAGIIGVTTAYELAADGHEVHVFERHSSACEETSFANAGILGPGYVTPWAMPRMPFNILKNGFQKHAPVKFKLPMQYSEIAWIRAWLKACQSKPYSQTQSTLQQLVSYSAERLQTLTQTLQLDYDQSSGYMMLLRSEAELALIQPSLQVLTDSGMAHQLVDAAGARKREPALCEATALHAAVHFPDDKVANCRQFALLLKGKAAQLGAKFHFQHTVSALQPYGTGINVVVNGSSEPFDQVVLCAGVDSAALARPLGVHLPLIPVYGYSVSAAVREPLDAPVSGIMDERYQVTISRMGNRVRVAGSAEIGGHANKISASAIQTLYKVLDDWFPAAADTQHQIQVWKGARPMLPSGSPRIGPSSVPRLWLNLGHGAHGWALSCGSARALADKIAGQKTTIDF